MDYIVNMHDRRRKNRVFHVNMLRPWYETPATSMMAVEVGSSDYEDDISLWREEADDNSPAIGTKLEADQKDKLHQLLREFTDVFQDRPGLTNLTKHDIKTGAANPVRLPPYRLPHAYREHIQKELQEMLSSGIIEPSQSGWSSPLVPVKKKDRSLRLCVDYQQATAQPSVQL